MISRGILEEEKKSMFYRAVGTIVNPKEEAKGTMLKGHSIEIKN